MREKVGGRGAGRGGGIVTAPGLGGMGAAATPAAIGVARSGFTWEGAADAAGAGTGAAGGGGG